MTVVRSPVRSCVRSVVRDVFGVVDGQTDLQRILALSPSLLVWPANGAGWQGTSGGTLAASGQPLGLGVDLSQLEGKTLSEWLATAPDLRSGGSVGLVGTATAATYNSSTGAGTVTRGADVANQSFVAWSGLAVSAYYLDVENSGGANNISIRSGNQSATIFVTLTPGQRQAIVMPPGSGSITITSQNNSTTASFTVHAFEAFPGNHLRAGTWASPSDAARGTFQNNAINFSGVDDYYSLLNAISITTNMTVVRAFKRASAGIRSIGLGTASINLYDAYWLTDNTTATALGNAGAIVGTANTSTGSFVFSSVRNAATTLVRRNGAQIGSTTAPGVANSFGAIGLMNTAFNSGEVSFLAVFPTELTGANLALVEQIAASTNSAVLA